MTCTCLNDRPDETRARINLLAEALSIEVILVILEDNLCPHAAEIMMGRFLAAMSARVYLLRVGKEEAQKLEGLNVIQIPATRQTLESIIGHARAATEENTIARS